MIYTLLIDGYNKYIGQFDARRNQNLILEFIIPRLIWMMNKQSLTEKETLHTTGFNEK